MGVIVYTVQEHFPIGSKYELALKPFLSAFSVTYTSMSRYKKSSTYTKYVFLKPEESFKEGFGFEREILCILSEKKDFQAKDAEIIDIIYNQNKSRVDPFVCVLISDCEEIHTKIEKLIYKESDNICIIPFTYSSLINKPPSISDIRTTFQNYMYKRDLFAIESPIKKDISFFGREDILISIIDRFAQGQNSGLFGLRKIGKTSVLYAIERRIKSKNIGDAFYLDCSNPSIYKSRWYNCLQTIIKKYIDGLEITNKSDIYAYNFNYNEKTAANYFEHDINQIMKICKYDRVLMMLDEIEWISFKTSTEPLWEFDFLPFWQTIRSIHQKTNGRFCFLICGVNPKCVEEESVSGYDNPLFALISPTFLQPFDTNTTKEMVSKLGEYMGIKFNDDLYPKLYELYGGHPFLIRRACSKLCQFITTRPMTFNLAIFNIHINKINSSIMPYVKQILNVLAIWYPEEYQMVIELAKGNVEKIKKYAEAQPEYIGHLLGYGIVNIVDGSPKLSIFIMSMQIKNNPHDSRLFNDTVKVVNKNKDDIIAEISVRRYNIEQNLRKFIKHSLKMFYGNKCMDELLKSVDMHRSAGLSRFGYDDVWQHLFFTDLILIIEKNWNCFDKWFSRDKSEVTTWLKHINEFRIDAHAKDITEDDLTYLRVAFTRLEESLKDFV